METWMGRALGDLAKLAGEKWYALMALFGFIILAWVLVAGTPHDDMLIALIAASMAAFGCAEGETRKTHHSLEPGYGTVWQVARAHRVPSVLGDVLLLCAVLLLLSAIGRGIYLAFFAG